MQGDSHVAGVYAAVVTPLDEDGAPDVDRLVRLCRWLLGRGCDGLAILGTTGEANSFSVEERLAVIESVVDAGVPPAALLPGVGCCAIPDTVRLTRAALAAGCSGVLMLPPFYYKDVSDDGVFAAYSEVVDRVGDARLRVVLYHFPKLSGVPVGTALIERLRTAWPDIFIGIKDSSGDCAAMIGMVRHFPGFAVMSGADDLFWPVLRAGGAGCITAVANVASPLAARVLSAWRHGDGVAAEAAHAELAAVRRVFAAHPLTAALKATLARLTGETGWLRIRPPLVPLEGDAAAALTAGLKALPAPLIAPGEVHGL